MSGEDIEKVADMKDFWDFLMNEAVEGETWWLSGWLDGKLEEYIELKDGK